MISLGIVQEEGDHSPEERAATADAIDRAPVRQLRVEKRMMAMEEMESRCCR